MTRNLDGLASFTEISKLESPPIFDKSIVSAGSRYPVACAGSTFGLRTALGRDRGISVAAGTLICFVLVGLRPSASAFEFSALDGKPPCLRLKY